MRPGFVLSAKYGLVDPDAVIETYDQTLNTASQGERRRWSALVLSQLESALGNLRGVAFECHAGSGYLDYGLVHGILDRGGSVERPVERLRFGNQLAFYAAASPGLHEPGLPPVPAVSRNPRPRLPPRPDLVSAALPEPLPPRNDSSAVVAALLGFGDSLPTGQLIAIGPDPESDALIRSDGFAFLLAVMFDQGIRYERAWHAPYDLRQRLGHLDPSRMMADPEAVRRAVAEPPALHRYVNNLPSWIVFAAGRVIEEYGGDAERIWNDRPTAEELRRRLERFQGIGPKKAAMAVEILERQLGADITHLQGSDIAFDVHVRRVFLRSGIAELDNQRHMIERARQLHPERPGGLDYPAWWVGHEWCLPSHPLCHTCPISEPCPKLIDRARGVSGG